MEICRNGRIYLDDFHGSFGVCGLLCDPEDFADPKDSKRSFDVYLLDVAAVDDDSTIYLSKIPHEGDNAQSGKEGSLCHHRSRQRRCWFVK